MKAQIIDGKRIAELICKEVQTEVNSIISLGKTPGLAVVLVGDDPASEVYVRNKGKACSKAGIQSLTKNFPAEISQKELLDEIQYLNKDNNYHGLLVQLPLPKHIDPQKIIEAISPLKDVDCFHPFNVGRLVIGMPEFRPATPAGIVELLKRYQIDTSGKHVVILGRSNIVGKPLANLLVQKERYANSIVTVVHSAAKNLTQFTRQADILVSAMGCPEFITSEMVKEGVVAIDVGINRVEADTPRGYRLAGDFAFDELCQKASHITPVPGGVGPMTIAMLLKNTIHAYRLQTIR